MKQSRFRLGAAARSRRFGGSRAATLIALALIAGIAPLATEAAADTEPNNVVGAAESIGVGTAASRAGQITPAGDQDYYRFTGVEGGTYVVEIYNVASDLSDVGLTAYNAAGTVLQSTSYCNAGGDVCARIQFTTSSAGSFFLRAKAYSSDRTGTYRIRVLPRYDQGLTRAASGEPNDAQALAEPISVGTAGTLTRVIYPRTAAYKTITAEQDYYRFTGTAGGTYVAEILNVAGDLGDMGLTVSNLAGTTLGSTAYCNATGDVCARIEFTTSIAGTFFLRARPYSTDKSGVYAIRVLPRYDQGLTRSTSGEPNDVLALAEPITTDVGGALTRRIYPRTPEFKTTTAEQDWYRFSGIAGRTYVAEILNVADDLGDMGLLASNASGTVLGSTSYCNGTGNVCARVQFTTSTAGTFFLRARPYSATKSGTYTIRVLPRYDQGLTRAASGEPNDAQALAEGLTVGTGVTRTIYPRTAEYVTIAAEQDYYRFSGVAGATYVVELSDVAKDAGSMNLYAYNASGTTIASTSSCNVSGSSVCARLQFSTSTAGTFFLRARPSSADKSGSYTIRVRRI